MNASEKRKIAYALFGAILSCVVVSAHAAPRWAEAAEVNGSAAQVQTVPTSLSPSETTGQESAEQMPEVTIGPQPEPSQSTHPEPQESSQPAQSVLQEPSPPTHPAPKRTVSPATVHKKKAADRLKPVTGVKLMRYSTNSIIVRWKQNKKANYYRVYYAKGKGGTKHLAGITKNNGYKVDKLKNKTTYYFYVKACKGKKASDSDSERSVGVHMKTKTYVRKTIFAGDSITQGIATKDTYERMKVKGKKKVVAAVGLNTVTFHTKRVFDGRTGLQKLIAERPSRVYMMLGMNEIHYRPVKSMIEEYKEMILAIREETPDTDIVLCAVSPVTREEKKRHPGHWQIPVFNRELKKLAEKMGVRYFDYTGFLKDSEGYLKMEYATGDGYHWKPGVYAKFAEQVKKYERSLLDKY